MKNTCNIEVTMSGLLAYAFGATTEGGALDVLMLSATGGHVGQPAAMHDLHTATLSVPTDAVRKGSSSPDLVLDAGGEEYAVWRLDRCIIDVLVDGVLPPQPPTHTYEKDGSTPTPENEDSLGWLPSVSAASEIALKFRADCLPPRPDPSRVNSVLRLRGGKARAYWAVEQHKTECWRYVLPDGGADGADGAGVGALADGIVWSLGSVGSVEFVIRVMNEPSTRHVIVADASAVAVALSNKTGTVEGRTIFEEGEVIGHFARFYELMEPAPGLLRRRVPTPADCPCKGTDHGGIGEKDAPVSRTTKLNRCPGASA